MFSSCAASLFFFSREHILPRTVEICADIILTTPLIRFFRNCLVTSLLFRCFCVLFHFFTPTLSCSNFCSVTSSLFGRFIFSVWIGDHHIRIVLVPKVQKRPVGRHVVLLHSFHAGQRNLPAGGGVVLPTVFRHKVLVEAAFRHMRWQLRQFRQFFILFVTSFPSNITHDLRCPGRIQGFNLVEKGAHPNVALDLVPGVVALFPHGAVDRHGQVLSQSLPDAVPLVPSPADDPCQCRAAN
mmetsp:Transcript_31347/g.47612  ORF Transcript_31347/g.47612 Transcript_31347/m.47612 type:complete len:240 (-) Transcript_31347:504-1223(-)